ncbi:hypothetical protein JCM10449v2_000523 [Rhodotorula kratochvilovae]
MQPSVAASLNPHRLSTQSSSTSSSSSTQGSLPSAGSTAGRITPVSSRLTIDVPTNDRFVRPASALGDGDTDDADDRSRDEAVLVYGRSGGYGEVGAGVGTSRQHALDTEDDSADEDESSPPRTPVVLPRSPARGADVLSDDDDAADFHDARDDWFSSVAGSGALLNEAGGGIGLGLGVAGPSTPSPRRREHAQDGVSAGSGAERKARTHESSESSGEVPPQGRRGSLPFPSRAFAPVLPDAAPHDVSSAGTHPSRPALASHASRSTDASQSSTVASSNSSTVSLPTAPPVDLSLPNRPAGPFVSVANGPMANLAAGNAPAQRTQNNSGGARSFFSNLLNRSPRSANTSPRFGSPTGSASTSPNPSIPRSPSAPLGWQHPSVTSLQSNEGIHSRSTSMPALAAQGDPVARASSDLYRPPTNGLGASPPRRTPRSIAAATFAGLSRTTSLRGASGSPSLGPPAPLSSTSAGGQRGTSSPVPTIGFATPPLPSAPAPEPPTLASIGLSLVPLTQPLSLSRSAQPLCGAILDKKFLLIGTTAGLDFLPLPLPGSLPMQQLGGKKRKDTRKPIPLIKRTRFKELAVLSERSNILLAIAGRNDHIRVYALDGIRAMIEKKMQEVDIKDGYPIIHDASIFDKSSKLSSGIKGKARARTTSDSLSAPPPAPPQPTINPSYQFPPSSSSASAAPPPDYPAPSPTTRRRPPSWHQRPPSWHQAANPASPVRISSRPLSASFVRAVPTNPPAPRASISSQATVTPASARTIRGQKSREFIAGRRSSTTATMRHRRSRADLDSPSESRRASVHSHVSRRGSTRRASEDDTNVGAGASSSSAARRLSVPAVPRRPSTASDAGWQTDASAPTPPLVPAKRMEPRAPVKPLPNPHERSPTSDLAEFLRDSGPEMRSPEMDTVLASSRRRRRSSITDNLLQAGPAAQLFPGQKPGRPQFARSATASHLAGLALYTAQGDTGDLVEMLREPDRAEEHRRASTGNLRRIDVDDDERGVEAFRPRPREACTPPLKAENPSPVLELAELIRRSGPDDHDEGDSSVPPPLPPKPQARGPTTPLLGVGQKSPSMELADLLRDTGPDDSSGSASPTRGFSTLPDQSDEERGGTKGKTRQRAESTSAAAAREAALNRLEARPPFASAEEGNGAALAEVIRDGPPPSSNGGSPSSRASKRWTMSAVGSKLLNRASPTPDSSPSKRPASSASQNNRVSVDSQWTSAQWEMIPDARRLQQEQQLERERLAPFPRTSAQPAASLAPPAPIRNDSSDRKRRPTNSLHRDATPTIAPASQAPPDAHPANSSSPLEYVKLARTKGARMLRAIETKKRTYLAVLCGEEAERIELFTGSRSISLSLNRTFVLPETPRTIEFQLQGDDLVDIYLVYPESIFALEPATVRVREVGVGRTERRARRERERRMRTLAATTTAPLPAEGEEADDVRSPNLHLALHPADPARQEQEGQESDAADVPEGEGVAVPLDPRSRSPSPSPLPDAAPAPSADLPPPPDYDLPSRDRTQSNSTTNSHLQAQQPAEPARAPLPSSSSTAARSKLPYSTFQQLPFVPPVPSSVLSSAWTIPPLYSDVVAGGSPAPSQSSEDEQPQPSITVTGANGIVSEARERVGAAPAPLQTQYDIPLLSPVSLLGGAAIRQNGPPGLFFVSKGQTISGIVTADGKSIIKRPLIWSQDPSPPLASDTECSQRLEVLVVGGARTLVVKLSPTDVKAISVDGGSSPFSAAVPVCRPNARASIQFLATHYAGQQVLYSQTVGQTYTIQCLAASRF